MSKNSLDWKEVGQLVAMSVILFTSISKVLKAINVGPGIIGWLNSSGKEFFGQKLTEIGMEYLRQTFPIIRGTIDTDIYPKLPMALGLSTLEHYLQGKVVIERRFDGLYVDNKQVFLRLSELQLCDQIINGHGLRQEIINGKEFMFLSGSILDFLIENPGYVPEEWKNIGRIVFWGTTYRNFRGDIYARSWVNGNYGECGLDANLSDNVYSAVQMRQ